MSNEMEKIVDAMDDEIHQLKIQNEGLLHELTVKDETIANMSEECDD